MTANDFKKLISCGADEILSNIDYLTQLDTLIGDGDHGITMEKISNVIKKSIDKMDSYDIKTGIEDLSWDLMSLSGGSAGPLWGSYFEGMAEGYTGDMDENCVISMLVSAYENFSEISGAKPGNKTMIDSLYPAMVAIKATEGNLQQKINAAANAALDGANKTENMIAKYGRAKNIKEKSIGHKDPGAVSFALFFKGMSNCDI